MAVRHRTGHLYFFEEYLAKVLVKGPKVVVGDKG